MAFPPCLQTPAIPFIDGRVIRFQNSATLEDKSIKNVSKNFLEKKNPIALITIEINSRIYYVLFK